MAIPGRQTIYLLGLVRDVADDITHHLVWPQSTTPLPSLCQHVSTDCAPQPNCQVRIGKQCGRLIYVQKTVLRLVSCIAVHDIAAITSFVHRNWFTLFYRVISAHHCDASRRFPPSRFFDIVCIALLLFCLVLPWFLHKQHWEIAGRVWAKGGEIVS